jgi:hypothetical protein
MTDGIFTADVALWTGGLLASVGVFVSAAEDLRRPGPFQDDGLLSWRVARLESAALRYGGWGRLAHLVFDYRRFRFVLALRLVAAAGLVVAFGTGGSPLVKSLLLLALLTTTMLLSLRCLYGHDGAHQMWILVLAALWLASLFPPGDIAQELAAWFIALQLILSYTVAGVAKLASPLWRNGTALKGIIGTRTYGHEGLHRWLLNRPGWRRMACWGVIVFECGFFAVLLVPLPLALLAILAGTLFHLIIAWAMGLNDFLFAFLAAYPSLLYCAFVAAHAIGGSDTLPL